MKVFYWYRSMIGRWAPCIDTRFPSRGPDHPMPKLAFPAIELKDENENLTLDECIAKWPALTEEPYMVSADPLTPSKPQDEGEALFSLPMTEVEPEKAKS